MIIIDAHQHFWQYDPIRDTWIDETMGVLKKDFFPMDLKPVLDKNRVSGCVAVQADQSENETDFLLDIAHRNPFVKGVVGWVDLLSENVDERLSHFSNNPLFKGVRHIVQAEPEGFMLRSDFQRGLAQLRTHNLTYDILIHSHQLQEARELVATFDEQPFILDHLAKPNIKEGHWDTWNKNITELAKFPNVYCKLSGMVTEAVWNHWAIDDFKPYIETIFECFGPDRVIFGSDWPVCLLSGSYLETLTIVDFYTRLLSDWEKAKIMGGNAIRVYNLEA